LQLPAHLGLALDVDHPRTPASRTRAEMRAGHAEGEPPSSTRQPVHTARASPTVSMRRCPCALLAQALADARLRLLAGLDGAIDFGRPPPPCVGAAGEVVGLAQHVGQVLQRDGELAASARRARALLDAARDPRAVQRPQPLRRAIVAIRALGRRFPGPRSISSSKSAATFEQLRELRVEGCSR